VEEGNGMDISDVARWIAEMASNVLDTGEYGSVQVVVRNKDGSVAMEAEHKSVSDAPGKL
jgi:hypothetical protein